MSTPESSLSGGSLSVDADRSVGSSSGHPSGDEPIVTFRFDHKEDADGHHVIIGREAKLIQCEDEPIRTPGAVQGFGVLIAVHEDTTSDRLVVRQVSENSTELLGLSPRYLFSLPCLTDVLPDSQVDVIWDNIQYLSDPDPNSTSEETSPHVFLLHGYGMPGSALADHAESDPQQRRYWSCWCAAHRPSAPAHTTASTGAQDLIILEFELDRDLFNPLHPGAGSDSTPTSSPGSGEASSSPGSSNTLVSDSEMQSKNRMNIYASESTSTTRGSNSTINPSNTPAALSPSPASSLSAIGGLDGDETWSPSVENIVESTTNYAKPLPALERIRRMSRADVSSPSAGDAGRKRRGRRGQRTGAGMMDVFGVMNQINEQLSAATDLDTFLKVSVGVIKDLTQFHRVLVYQFDDSWNGQTVAELVDWNQTHDLYKGLHFPAADIPAQRWFDLYAYLDKTRLLYDREQVTARLVVRNAEDLLVPLNMTHCYLRAMSPIHLKYLANMGVRSSMSVSITAFGQLWGLVACHSYGSQGIRVSFPVRQMLRLLSDSISRNVERLSYAHRLHTRKLINTIASDQHSTGYIVSNADDLLGLFDADFGVLVIGEGAKILGPNQHGQEVLVMAEYLRLKQFNMIQVSQAVTKDFPDLQLSTGLEVVAGMLFVPLSKGGKDFIAFLRKGQTRHVRWAGKPFKEGQGQSALEPRNSFKVWSETVAGRSRAWTDEQLETAGVLALVYGKFIEVWRQKENALQTTKLTNILLSNAGHEVRTPLNHIINCLELALHGSLDVETRENLNQSHAASKSLLFTINDLLDLTRLESGHETSSNEPFDLPAVIEEATNLYKSEALRRNLRFRLDLSSSPRMVVGDPTKIRTVVANSTANALKYTENGEISITCREYEEPQGLRTPKQVVVEIVVSDTGCGIPAAKLESIFREFEQVESSQPKVTTAPGLGLGLAVVARIVEQLGGQLRVDSTVDEGSRFSFLIPFVLPDETSRAVFSRSSSSAGTSTRPARHRTNSHGSGSSHELDSLVVAISNTFGAAFEQTSSQETRTIPPPIGTVTEGGTTLRTVKVDDMHQRPMDEMTPRHKPSKTDDGSARGKLRVLVVEDNDVNRMILAKRLSLDGHAVVNTTNGQEGVEAIMADQQYDCVLMDIQMPILNGFEATQRIRKLEATTLPSHDRVSHNLNGRIPIFAVSASLLEKERDEFMRYGIDGWILKPIDWKRLRTILRGVTDPLQRQKDEYRIGSSWELGGWFPRHTHQTSNNPTPFPTSPPLETHTPST
ncbi:hypothetical protein FA95DRAFT_1485478 [Auriscalpium vulgare]|uniref:Uncharacterized protein n=1 Tax=Auriscalpium vulgare TaxID=40419 RepID=A0ACB8S5J6_9AGAM|nr:hypothetical protein FA95DRAFT_1485478 [Auriscalpium vulgare]